MPVVLVGIVLVLLLAGPALYVQWAMRRHDTERPDLPGTGGELARHLLDAAGLHHVTVELTDQGDHYDPATLAVRLGPGNLHGRSVTAVAVAAHEVAHAVQHRDNTRLFGLRLVLMRVIMPLRMAAIALMTLLPVLGTAAGAGHLVLPSMGLAFVVFALSVLAQLVTVPLEFDASFGRALPALTRGRYLAARDLDAARQVLGAAAMTYVASAALSFLNMARIIR